MSAIPLEIRDSTYESRALPSQGGHYSGCDAEETKWPILLAQVDCNGREGELEAGGGCCDSVFPS